MYKCEQCDKSFENNKQYGGHMSMMIKNGKHHKMNKKGIYQDDSHQQ